MPLLELVSYLSGKGLIDVSKLTEDSGDGLHSRLEALQYVYLAKYFGLDLGYWDKPDGYDLYPYRLQDDFFALDLAKVAPRPAPPGLREADYLSVVSGRDYGWLHIAALIMRQKELGRNYSPGQIDFMTYGYKLEFITSVYEDVRRLILPLAPAAPAV